MNPDQTISVRIGRIIPAGEVDTHRLAPLFEASRLLSRERQESVELREAAEIQTRELIERSRAQAEEILRSARNAVASEASRAFEIARSDAASEFSGMLIRLSDQISAYRDTAELDLQKLAMRFARALVNAELSLRPERVAYLVRSALVTARFLDHAVVRLHPEDASCVREHMGLLTAGVSGKTVLSVVDDPALPKRSVRVETSRGDITSSIDDFFNRLADALLSTDPLPADFENPLRAAIQSVESRTEQSPVTWQENASAGWAGAPAEDGGQL